MNIYIASSWKNQAAVEMLTSLLREMGHVVASFVENNYGEGHSARKPIDFEEWVKTPAASKAFQFDTLGAATSDLVIYVAPSGKDAAAEVGIAWGRGVPVIGLFAKGEDFGLMRKLMIAWFERYADLLNFIGEHEKSLRVARLEMQKNAS